MFNLFHGDCLDALRSLDDSSVDSVVTDPPYGLKFMGKKWDHSVPGIEVWAECLRVLKPGGHLLCFAGTRTHHRMACNIEDAGFEIRDMIAWLYGSGFPKSHDISKAIDKAAGAEREKEWKRYTPNTMAGSFDQRPWLDEARANGGRMIESGPPVTEDANKWQGWGTALKPALEPITMARKPFPGTVAQNVLEHGTGAINVDGCRVGDEGGTTRSGQAPYAESGWRTGHEVIKLDSGRWPANLIHDGSDDVIVLFPQQQSGALNREGIKAENKIYGKRPKARTGKYEASSGSAARFFYCAKASKKDREDGCEGMEAVAAQSTEWSGESMPLRQNGTERKMPMSRNHHPTVKPTDLMRYLCRLVTPPGGLVLDPFMGSGSTGKAAILEGFQFVGIEREAEYIEIAKSRILQALDTKGQIDG